MREINAIVVGDSCLDRYFIGSVNRISPDAPCPIVDVNDFIEVPGGAANVAMNLSTLGAGCDLVTVLGGDDDDEGTTGLHNWFSNTDNVKLWTYHLKGFQTPIKTRICTLTGQQLLRFDIQSPKPCSDARARNALMNRLQSLIEAAIRSGKPSVVVLSDYGKGVFADDEFVKTLLEMAYIYKVPTIVDPKSTNLRRYSPVCLIKPNLKEAQAATGGTTARECAERLLQDLSPSAEGVLVTAGIDGMILATMMDGKPLIRQIPAYPPHLFCNPCGAGDTVTAVLATQLASVPGDYAKAKFSFRAAAKAASIGAGIVVEKAGTALLHDWEFEAGLADNGAIPQAKVADMEAAVAIIASARGNGEVIALANGCFDQLHPGHVHLLSEGKRLSDMLIVALNSDESVRALKGEGRPIIPCDERIKMLEALQCVDLIIVFDENTPEKLIRMLKPDLLIKGEEYIKQATADIPGAEFVIENGEGVVFVTMLEGYSTTSQIEKSRDAEGTDADEE
jgi:D-beta-D-heptose 7-phosphate kinase/D-beta-D-heptose 1-phosphate adenosyltransferase